MSGSKPPGWEPDAPDPADPISHQAEPGGEPVDELAPDGDDVEDGAEPFDDGAESAADQTDAYSRAYSAPESEHFTSAPYMPADLRLYDYEDYDCRA